MLHYRFVCLSLSLSILSATAAYADGGTKVHVEALNPDVDLSVFAGQKDIQVDHDAPEDQGIPSRQDRDQIFADAGLNVAAMDDLDRDDLFLRARYMDIARLHAHYPDFSTEKLEHLKKLVDACKGRSQ